MRQADLGLSQMEAYSDKYFGYILLLKILEFWFDKFIDSLIDNMLVLASFTIIF